VLRIRILHEQKKKVDSANDVDAILVAMTEKYKRRYHYHRRVKIDFANEWVHLRKSNTEPIIRIYTEAPSKHRLIR
jgi:phosphomannomutase